jgi:hypothetical protein
MSKILIDQMWEQLAQHQPVADELGYGSEWRRMCKERTENAADVAADAAADADACAAAAAWAAAVVLDNAAEAEYWAEHAIELITKAEGRS